jgi:hypothetical protein
MFAVAAPPRYKMIEKSGTILVTLKGDDIYRLKAEVEGAGWKVELQNELAASADGSEITIPLYLSRQDECSKNPTITLRVASECNEDLFSEIKIAVKR